MSGAEISRRRARRYRRRQKAGCRIFRLELDVVAVEEFLLGLDYIPAEGATKKEVDEALAKFVAMLAGVTRDDMHSSFLLRQTIEHFESAKDALP